MSKSRLAMGALLALGSVPALAEVDIRVRAGAGVGVYSVDSNLSTGGRRVEYEADFIAVPVGVTLIFDNELYLDLVHQSASGEAEFAFSAQKPDFSRDDTTLTIGGRVENVSVYVGYKTSEAITDWPTGFAPDKLTTQGFLAGFGWAIPFANSAFNLNAGVGVLHGEYTFLDPFVPLSDPTRVDNPLESETTLGFSVGAGYTYVFSPHFSVNADFKYQSYDYKFRSFFVKENPSHLVASLLYTF